jgi:hypothetical protein
MVIGLPPVLNFGYAETSKCKKQIKEKEEGWERGNKEEDIDLIGGTCSPP